MVDILKHLVERNTLTQEQASGLRVESERTGRHPDELILAQGLIDEATLFAEKAAALGIKLSSVDVEAVPLEALEVVPEDSASYYYMIPLAKLEGVLEIGMVFPEDVEAQEALKFLARQENFTYRISLITLSSFRELMRKYHGLKQEVGKALQELAQEKVEVPEGAQAQQKGPRIVEEAPITKMVAVILRTAVEQKASDVHIEPFSGKVRVRFRILGQLQSSLQLPERVKRSIVARIKILAGMKIDETRIPQDGRFSMTVDGKEIDFRVATFPTPKGEKVAIRVLDPAAAIQGFEELGLEGDNASRVKASIRRPYGMILVTGPTGSGKTTTLYTILQLLNTEDKNIVSLEDPVEYFIDGVNQSQIQPAVGYDFASGLRQILRQDPNVIMVGEVRDEESATLVTHAALTGHLVLSTLHTNSAVGIIPRLVDMGVKKYLIPSTLQLGISQRLVRRLCQECREAITLSPEMRTLIEEELKRASKSFQKRIVQLRRGEDIPAWASREGGCASCGKSGYAGRIALFEVLAMDKTLEEIILGDPTESKLEEAARAQGMVTMFQDGILKVVDGVTTIEEVLRVTGEANI